MNDFETQNWIILPNIILNASNFHDNWIGINVFHYYKGLCESRLKLYFR